jgi:glycine betaine/proline transport system permease protein
MMALAMVVVSSMIGAKGLGLEVLLAINRIEVGRGFEAGLCIVFMAIVIDRITFALATKKKH